MRHTPQIPVFSKLGYDIYVVVLGVVWFLAVFLYDSRVIDNRPYVELCWFLL